MVPTMNADRRIRNLQLIKILTEATEEPERLHVQYEQHGSEKNERASYGQPGQVLLRQNYSDLLERKDQAMERRLGRGTGESRVPLRPEALLNALRPHCMATMVALEDIIGSEGDKAAGVSLPSGLVVTNANHTNTLAAKHIADVRRLEATLSDYNDCLRGILRPSSTVRVVDMQRAVAPTLPFVMLPLRLALAPAKPAPSGSTHGEGGSTLGGKQMGPAIAKGIAEGKMPAGVREKALLCITAAIRGSDVRFVEGYGVRPTFDILVALVCTLAESSPTTQSSPLCSGEQGVGGVGGADGVGRGSSLNAGTEALRSACLECLEALLRAPFDLENQYEGGSDSSAGKPESQQSTFSPSSRSPGGSTLPPAFSNCDTSVVAAWEEVQHTLQTAVGGGLLAQLVQELLLCCQAGGGGGGAAVDSGLTRSGRGRIVVGGQAARSAAGCLNALCSFASDTQVWRRFLPGTFSGLFRAIRGMEAKYAPSAEGPAAASAATTLPPALYCVSHEETATQETRYFGPGASSTGRPKSALVEVCLDTLAKVLLICAGAGDSGAITKPLEAGPRNTEVDFAAGSSSGNEDGTKRDDANGDNPLLVLQRLALTSNSATGSGKADEGASVSKRTSSTGGSPVVSTVSPNNPVGSLAGSAATHPQAAIHHQKIKQTPNSRKERWESETSGRLRLLLPPLLAFCRLHAGWRVRRAAATFASSLLVAGGGAGDWDAGGSGAGKKDHGTESGAGDDEESVAGRMPGVAPAIGERAKPSGDEGLLEPLRPLLIEALVGLVLDDMPQVSAAAREGLDSFRSTLSSLRWLALRGLLLDRLCAIAEGLPALATSADEKRLRGAFDLLAGYLSLLGTDARAVLDARLLTVLSCICEALEFDQDFNVQVLEGSHVGTKHAGGSWRTEDATVDGTTNGGGSAGEESPKYYRQVLLNARDDTTLASARRAVRLLGTCCDIASLADAAISSLEARYPRPRRVQHPPDVGGLTPRDAGNLVEEEHHRGGLTSPSNVAGGFGGNRSSDDSLYRRRCLEWLRPRLPMAWVLNQAFLGRVLSSSAASAAGAGVEDHGAAHAGTGKQDFLGRGFAMAWLDRLLASQAFSLPTSKAEAMADGYGCDSIAISGYRGQAGAALLPAGGTDVIKFTRLGEVLGGGGGGSSPEFSGQVLNANATLASLIIEAIAALAEACGRDLGEDFLRRALYPLLEKAASTHRIVSQAALATLWRVRSACGDFENMSQLLAANMDYVVDDVIRRVALAGASSAAVRRANAGRGQGIHFGVVLQGGGPSTGGGGVEIASVVEAVLRIGGSAMGRTLVKDLAGVTLKKVDACAWDPSQSRRSIRVLHAVASCVTLPPSAITPTVVSTSVSTDNIPTPTKGKRCDGPKASAKVDGGDRRKPAGAPGEKEEVFADSESSNEEAASSGGVSLSESPWFRQLFVEFADASDVRRMADGGGPGAAGLLETLRQRREEADFEDANYEASTLHSDEGDEDNEGALPEPDAEGRKIAESQEVKTLSEVLARSCYFMSTPSLATQAAALACMRDCVLKLATAGASAALLPHVHKSWRPLMAIFREFLSPLSSSTFALATAGGGGRASLAFGKGQSDEARYQPVASRRAVLLHALDTVDALVGVCGDFMSIKVAEDLWPLLKVLLLQYALHTTVRKDGGRNTTNRIREGASTSIATTSRQPRQQTLFTSNPSLSLSGDGRGSDLLLTPTYARSNERSHSGSNGMVSPTSPAAASTVSRDGGGGGEGGGGSSTQHAGVARVGLLEAKVVTRALECLEGLCQSPSCEDFMTPLAREVALAALPCLSSAGPDTIQSAAESLFERLLFLDGDGVWLLLTQTLDAAGALQQQSSIEPRDLAGVDSRRQGTGVVSGARKRVGVGTSAENGWGRFVVAVERGGKEGTVLGNLRRRERTKSADLGRVGTKEAAGVPKRDTGMFLPFSPPMCLGSLLYRGQPCPLKERKSVFTGSIAKECTPIAARLLSLLNSGPVAEHA